MELSERAIEAILDGCPVASLATLGPGSRPHVVPIVFARVGGRLWSPIDGKPKAEGELARVRNIRRDSRISLLLEHYERDWTRLYWLRLDGTCRIRTFAAPGADFEIGPVLAALRRKYPQYQSVPLLGPQLTLLEIQIESRHSWCASAAARGCAEDRPGE